jgi:hypothetical protein
MGETCGTQQRGYANTALARKHEGTRWLGRQKGIWVDNIKIALVILLGAFGLHVCNTGRGQVAGS